MIRAPITPGTQPQRVRRKMISTEPQPLSTTARGGKRMHSRTRRRPTGIAIFDLRISNTKIGNFNILLQFLIVCDDLTALPEKPIRRLQDLQLQVCREIGRASCRERVGKSETVAE